MTFRLTTATGPTGEPVTLTQAKAQLRVDTSDDDTYIGDLITAARRHVENVTNRAFIERTYNYYLDAFQDTMELPKPPLSSITSITYTDTDGNNQALATSVYMVDTDAKPGQVRRAYGQTWPATRSIEQAVKITYVAGYAATASGDIPEEARRAMLLLIGHWYRNREAVTNQPANEVPQAVNACLAPLKVHTF